VWEASTPITRNARLGGRDAAGQAADDRLTRQNTRERVMFDAIVIGSGMSGGIAAKELCERGLKTLIIERGRKLEHGASYTDWMQPWDLPNAGGMPEEELARDYQIQRQCYAVNSATQDLWVKDSQHPMKRLKTSPSLDPRLSSGRPLDHVGAPDLSLFGDGFLRQRARRPRRRLADPLCRHGAVV
jgi:choline dehydrogenase-like flavoprotein